MRTLALAILASLISVMSIAQEKPEIDSLIKVGIQHHDQGEYEEAVKYYKRALKMEPDSPLANYEIAYSYLKMEEFNKAAKHADKVIQLDKEHVLHGYVTLGTCLDNMGKADDAIKCYKRGIKKFGSHHLLCYNLALTYYRQEDLEKAVDIITEGIKEYPGHASSHLILAYLMVETDQKVPSILCLYYFLMLESGSGRSEKAFALLRKQFDGNVSKDEDNPNQINIMLDPSTDDEFSAIELTLGLLAASGSLEKNEGKSEQEMFTENTESFFKVCGELNDNNKKKKGLWWNFYIPLFYEIAQSKHMEAYCHFISRSAKPESQTWIEEHPAKLEKFADWMSKQ